MNRITDKSIAEIRDANPIDQIIGKYVPLVEVEHTGYQGNCPFCGDAQSRFKVNPSLAMFMCRGCGLGGDVTTFVMLYRRVSFREAMEFLATWAGVAAVEEDTRAALAEARHTTTEEATTHG